MDHKKRLRLLSDQVCDLYRHASRHGNLQVYDHITNHVNVNPDKDKICLFIDISYLTMNRLISDEKTTSRADSECSLETFTDEHGHLAEINAKKSLYKTMVKFDVNNGKARTYETIVLKYGPVFIYFHKDDTLPLGIVKPLLVICP